MFSAIARKLKKPAENTIPIEGIIPTEDTTMGKYIFIGEKAGQVSYLKPEGFLLPSGQKLEKFAKGDMALVEETFPKE